MATKNEAGRLLRAGSPSFPRGRSGGNGGIAWDMLLLCCLGALSFPAQSAGTSPEEPGVTMLPSPPLPAPPPAVPPPAPPKPVNSSLSALTNTPIRVVGPGVFELGKVRMVQSQCAVSFPATLNLASINQGLMEYFLVTDYGKIHESILKTEAEPFHIHLAMLLLSSKGLGPNELEAAPEAQIKNPGKETLPGERVAIEVRWPGAGGQEERRSAEELVFRQDNRQELSKDAWVYNGSAVWNGRFLAQQDGSIVSLITDPVALVNNVGAGHDNDHIWFANTNRLPPANVPLEVTITLSESATNAKKAK